MSKDKTGLSFEQRAYKTLHFGVEDEKLGLLPKHSKVFHQKTYYSRDRNSDIVFDIAIEVTLPDAPTYSLLWLWECKDYAKPIPVDDIEEFHAKVQQVAGLNVKAGIFTSSNLQRSALEYARSRGIAVLRLLPDDQVDIMLYQLAPGSPNPYKKYAYADIEFALLEKSFRSQNIHFFGIDKDKGFLSAEALVEEELQALFPGVDLHEIRYGF